MKKLHKALAWVVSADMGYGHQRAIYPLKSIAKDGLISAGDTEYTTESEKKLWQRVLGAYEAISRTRDIPLIGKHIFKLLDFFLAIPPFYPIRNLTNATFQVRLLESSIKKGLCSGLLKKVQEEHLPLITSFYAPAIAADMQGYPAIYCIICDADLNRVWVANDPWESQIEYFAPCGKAARRLKAYGVPEQRIHLTGFPLPIELLGNEQLDVLKHDLGQRLNYLDPNNRFWPLHERNINYFLGEKNCFFKNKRKLTITYAVGGAGAQKEIGKQIAYSLKNKLKNNEVILNLVAGTRREVCDYFSKVKDDVAANCPNIRIIFGQTNFDYFNNFNQAIRTTDILWTKPSELSFYCGLGIPIIRTNPIGSQELFNKTWLKEIHAGFKQENPDYTHQWLWDLLYDGRLAEAAWSGFLKARKYGTYKILEILKTGKMTQSESPLTK